MGKHKTRLEISNAEPIGQYTQIVSSFIELAIYMPQIDRVISLDFIQT